MKIYSHQLRCYICCQTLREYEIGNAEFVEVKCCYCGARDKMIRASAIRILTACGTVEKQTENPKWQIPVAKVANLKIR